MTYGRTTARNPINEVAIPLYLASTAWAIPSSATEFLAGSTRRLITSLAGWREVRISRGISVIAAAGSVLRLQYTTTLTAGTTTGWTDLTPDVTAAAATSEAGAWGAIPDVAKTNVQIRIVGSGGDGTTSGTIQAVTMHLRR